MLKPLLDKILRPGVSDLHLKANEPPLIRQMGVLVPIGTQSLRVEDIEGILAQLLTEPQKNLLKKQGDVYFSHIIEGVARLRINVYRQRGTNAIAIRIIPGECKTFEELYLPKETLEKLSKSPRGLLLVSGMAGTGKTTTMNAIVNYMNENFSYNIITLEDPIEFTHTRKQASISQREIGRDVESFAEGVKFLLRQDPDVIVLGEMRTIETYEVAIEAAASGHLVIATVHGHDTLDTVDRIVNSFEVNDQPYARGQIASSLSGIICQRLVKDKENRGSYPATEIMLGNNQIRKLLIVNSPMEIRFAIEKGNAFGMHSFDQDLIRMVGEGLVNASDAVEMGTNQNDLRTKLQNTSSTPAAETK